MSSTLMTEPLCKALYGSSLFSKCYQHVKLLWRHFKHFPYTTFWNVTIRLFQFLATALNNCATILTPCSAYLIYYYMTLSVDKKGVHMYFYLLSDLFFSGTTTALITLNVKTI